MSERSEQSERNSKFVMEEVEKAVERCLEEGDITYAETIGALELVKQATIRKYFRLVEGEKP